MRKNIIKILLVTVTVLSLLGTTLVVNASNEPLEESIIYDGMKLIKKPWKKNLCKDPLYNKLEIAAPWLDNAIKEFSGEELKDYLCIEKPPMDANLEPIEGLAIGFCETEDGKRQKIEFILNPPKQFNCSFRGDNLHIKGVFTGIEAQYDFNYYIVDGRTHIIIEDEGIFDMLLTTFAKVKGLEDYPKSYFDEETFKFIIQFKGKTIEISPGYSLFPSEKLGGEAKRMLHIPLREVFESLGYVVYWEQDTRSIVII